MDKSLQMVEMGCQLLISNPEKGEFLIKEGLKADPFDARYWYNLGIAKHQNKKIKPAISCYRKALSMDYSEEVNNVANNNLAQELLLNGEWAEGWQRYIEKYRLEKESFQMYIKLYGELGQVLKIQGNSNNLLVSEQGYGNSIQFINLLVNFIKE